VILIQNSTSAKILLHFSVILQGHGLGSLRKNEETWSKAIMDRTVQAAVIKYFREIEEKLSSMRHLFEETQLQQPGEQQTAVTAVRLEHSRPSLIDTLSLGATQARQDLESSSGSHGRHRKRSSTST
jgi:hypothetical protein